MHYFRFGVADIARQTVIMSVGLGTLRAWVKYQKVLLGFFVRMIYRMHLPGANLIIWVSP